MYIAPIVVGAIKMHTLLELRSHGVNAVPNPSRMGPQGRMEEIPLAVIASHTR